MAPSMASFLLLFSSLLSPSCSSTKPEGEASVIISSSASSRQRHIEVELFNVVLCARLNSSPLWTPTESSSSSSSSSSLSSRLVLLCFVPRILSNWANWSSVSKWSVWSIQSRPAKTDGQSWTQNSSRGARLLIWPAVVVDKSRLVYIRDRSRS